MFGSIVIDPKALTDDEKARYRAAYCGLCRVLDVRFGSAGVSSLSYDMTFLAMLLGAVYGLAEEEGTRRCVPHPLKPHPTLQSAATGYAADMNLVLAYYQALDDWNDDKNVAAREKSRLLQPHLAAVQARCPRQCAAIQDGLAQLGQMEQANELNPDLPTNCFGHLLGEVFAWQQDAHAEALYKVGAALGRFVYLLDACNDLRADIKKQRYNPLVAQLDTDFLPLLTMMMAECTAAFETLPLHRDAHILQNVLYAGVWLNYKGKDRGEALP